MATVTTYNVTARHWKQHIDGVGVTQSRNLAEAETMVRDDGEARSARDAVAAADKATREAAARSRKVVRDLHQAGLCGRDIAAILGMSPQRISQLLKSA
jgi:DNA-directed RNA polymerase specialized sigma subunit